MDNLPVREIMEIGAFLIGLFSLWYKIRQDTKAEVKRTFEEVKLSIEKNQADTKAAAEKVKASVDEMKATAISRQEHERDMDKVQQQIRIFRDEVREDIRTLNSSLSQRLDFMIQRFVENKH